MFCWAVSSRCESQYCTGNFPWGESWLTSRKVAAQILPCYRHNDSEALRLEGSVWMLTQTWGSAVLRALLLPPNFWPRRVSWVCAFRRAGTDQWLLAACPANASGSRRRRPPPLRRRRPPRSPLDQHSLAGKCCSTRVCGTLATRVISTRFSRCCSAARGCRSCCGSMRRPPPRPTRCFQISHRPSRSWRPSGQATARAVCLSGCAGSTRYFAAVASTTRRSACLRAFEPTPAHSHTHAPDANTR